MTEEYSIGYSEGYQEGWNAAMDSTPPAAQRWVGLTNKDIIEMWAQTSTVGWDDIRLIEAKLKEKNNG